MGRAIVTEHSHQPGAKPGITFDGAMDYLDSVTVNHATAILTEALSNVARHAQATAIEVHVRADGRSLTIEVVDNGVGIAEIHHMGNGLGNMKARANALGGDCSISRNVVAGSVLHWTIPIVGTNR